jgi:4-hydroxybutyrate dehydrogenase
MTTVWSYPTRVLFGAGAVRDLGREVSSRGLVRVLLLTDPGVERAGLLAAPREALEQAGIKSTVFADISTNPREEEVETAASVYRSSEAEGIVAVGGGAAMDVAKLVVVRSQVNLPFEQLDDALNGGVHIPAALPPVFAVPTTAGTGSEVGRAAVLTVRSTGRKTVIFAPSMMPRVAVLDPELTLSLPRGPTASTGFDALTHCLEAYLATGDHPMADGIALAGLELVAGALPAVTTDGGNLEARGAMMKAAMMGAVAFQKGLGACHSLSHPLSAEFGLHHGLANALCLPAVVDFVEAVLPDRVQRVAQLFGASREAGALGDAMRRLRQTLGLPSGLAQVGIQPADCARLAPLAFADACHTSSARICTQEDLRVLYERSL